MRIWHLTAAVLLGVLCCPSVQAAEAADEVEIDVYGFVWLLAAWDETLSPAGEYRAWSVSDESPEADESRFVMSARRSRLGLSIDGPNSGSIETAGKVEFDFENALAQGGAANKGAVMLRHAYVEFKWPERDLAVLAGQTWDLTAYLNPTTVSYGPLYFAGNQGYRRAQVRVSKGLEFSEDTSLLLQAAASGQVPDSGDIDPDPNIVEPQGVNSPIWQARAALDFALGGNDARVEVSGHYGTELADLDTWSAQAGVSLPLGDRVTLKAEYYQGSNLDAFLGGIAQAVNVNGDALDSMGAWAQLGIKASDKVKVHLMYGFEEVDDDAAPASGRTRNQAIFANAWYAATRQLSFGFEVQQWTTEYFTLEDGDSLRVEGAVVYKF